MLNNEELLDAFVAEILGTVMSDEGFTKEKCVELKNQVLARMHPDEDYLDGPV